MTKSQIKELCLELVMSEREIDEMWNECANMGHSLISSLKRQNIDWRGMQKHAILGLPKQYDKLNKMNLSILDCVGTFSIAEMSEILGKDIDENYINKIDQNQPLKDLPKLIQEVIDSEPKLTEYELSVCKLKNGEKLSEHEIEHILRESNKVDEIEGDDRRWSRWMQTIIDIDDEYYMVEWDKGLTEMQENYYESVSKVKKETRIVTKEVTDWIKI